MYACTVVVLPSTSISGVARPPSCEVAMPYTIHVCGTILLSHFQ